MTYLKCQKLLAEFKGSLKPIYKYLERTFYYAKKSFAIAEIHIHLHNLLYLLQRSIKNQLYSLWFDPIRTQTSQSTALKSSMLTIQRIKKEILSKRISETLMNLKEKKTQTFL
jgi:hypothetical protein